MAGTLYDIIFNNITLRDPVGTRLNGIQWDPTENAVTGSVMHAIDLRSVRVHDSASLALLPQTSAADDLGLYVGTFGTASHIIKTYDVKTVGATTLYGRFSAFVPPRYKTGEGFKLRFYAGMLSALADTTCTIDCVAYKIDKESGIGSDLVTTSAISMNSLTFANKDFTLTSSGLEVGDELDVRVAITPTDGGGATAVYGAIGAIGVLCSLQG